MQACGTFICLSKHRREALADAVATEAGTSRAFSLGKNRAGRACRGCLGT